MRQPIKTVHQAPHVTFAPEGIILALLELVDKMVLVHGQIGFTYGVFVPLVLVVLCDAKPFLTKKACGMPDLPAHSTYQCQPPLCQEGSLDPGLFRSGTVLEFHCQPGYILAGQPALALCQGGQWSSVKAVARKPQGPSLAPPPQSSLLTAASIPIIAAAALTFSAFLVTVLSCVLLKPRFSVCRCRSGAYETFEDSDAVEHVEELDVNQSGRIVDPLPSYEEAVCGHTGTPLLPGGWNPVPPVLSEGVQPEPPGPSHVSPPLRTKKPWRQLLRLPQEESGPRGEQPDSCSLSLERRTDPDGASKSCAPRKVDSSVASVWYF